MEQSQPTSAFRPWMVMALVFIAGLATYSGAQISSPLASIYVDNWVPRSTTFVILLREYTLYACPILGALAVALYMDRKGHARGLITACVILGCATLLLAAIPGEKTAGVAAGIVLFLIYIVHLIFSQSVITASAVYLSETTSARLRCLALALLTVIWVLIILVIRERNLDFPTRLDWFIAVAAGGLILPVIALLYRRMPELPVSKVPLGAMVLAVIRDWRTFVSAALLGVLLPTAVNQFPFPDNVGQSPALLLFIIAAPISGALAARWSPWRVLTASAAGLLALSLFIFLIVQFRLGFTVFGYGVSYLAYLAMCAFLGAYCGVFLVAIMELVPGEARALGTTLAVLGVMITDRSQSPLVLGWILSLIGELVLVPLSSTGLNGALGIWDYKPGMPPGAYWHDSMGFLWVAIAATIALVVALRVRPFGERAATARQQPSSVRQPAPVQSQILPASASDPNWRERLIAALRDPSVTRARSPGRYVLQRHGALAIAVGLALFCTFVDFIFRYELSRVTPSYGDTRILTTLRWWELLSLLIFFPLIIVFTRMSWRAGAIRAGDEIEQAGSRRPIFYLRSFGLDKVIGRTSIIELVMGRALPNAEQVMASLLRRVGPVIAIGRPGEKLPALGAARFYVADERWKTTVQEIERDSQLVVWTTGTTEGLRWELEYLLANVAPERLIVMPHPYFMRILPPRREAEWRHFLATLGNTFPRSFPPRLGYTRCFHFDRDFNPIPELSLKAALVHKGLLKALDPVWLRRVGLFSPLLSGAGVLFALAWLDRMRWIRINDMEMIGTILAVAAITAITVWVPMFMTRQKPALQSAGNAITNS